MRKVYRLLKNSHNWKGRVSTKWYVWFSCPRWWWVQGYYSNGNSLAKKKLIKHFGEKLKMEKINTIWGALAFSSAPFVAEAIEKGSSLAVRKTCSRNVALSLREDIMRAEHNTLLENVTIDITTKGEFSAPDSLKNFFQYLNAGPDTRVWHSDLNKEELSH